MRGTLSLGILIFVLAASVAALPKIFVDPTRTGHFIDEMGRVRMFRGVNSVTKGFPWYDSEMLDEGRIANLAAGGFNVVRYGSMWAGFEPEEGLVNETYVDILKTQVDKFAQAGIYTLFDMHQDCLWEYSTDEYGKGYWGVPPWIKGKLPVGDNFPYPLDAFSGWFCAYFTEEVSKGFQDIYDDVANTRESLASFWRYVATTFGGLDGVFGYEIMNEPWAGDIVSDLSLMLPGVAGRRNLGPAWERAHSAIREVDDDTLLFYEPVTWGVWFPFRTNPLFDALLESFLHNLSITDLQPLLNQVCNPSGSFDWHEMLDFLSGILRDLKHRLVDMMQKHPVHKEEDNPPILGPGFIQVPGGEAYLNRSVLSWHWYCPFLPLSGSDGPYDPTLRRLCDDILGLMTFSAVDMWSGDLGGGNGRKAGSMLTEFGSHGVPDINSPESVDTIENEYILSQMDQRFKSWTYWNTYGLFDGPDYIEDSARFFVRPYPTATHGMPHTMSFDVYSAAFSFEFYPSVDDLTVPTEIFVPEMHYPNMSYGVRASPDLTWEGEGSVLRVYATEASQPDVLSFVNITKAI